MRALREHGQREKYRHELEGCTARLDTIQALVLLAQAAAARRLERAAARGRGATTRRRSRGVGDLRLPPVAPGSEPVWHLYVVRTADPTALAEHPRARAGSAPAATTPSRRTCRPRTPGLGYRPGAFPVAEALARECLSLPIFPGITEAQLEAVVDAVARATSTWLTGPSTTRRTG